MFHSYLDCGGHVYLIIYFYKQQTYFLLYIYKFIENIWCSIIQKSF